MPDTCRVKNCRGYSVQRKDYALFKLPDDPDLLQNWLRFLNLPDDLIIRNCFKVCSRHFEEKYIKRNTKRLRLLRSAVPSLYPGTDSPSDCSNSSPASCSLVKNSSGEPFSSDSFASKCVKQENCTGVTFIDCQALEEPLIEVPFPETSCDPLQ